MGTDDPKRWLDLSPGKCDTKENQKRLWMQELLVSTSNSLKLAPPAGIVGPIFGWELTTLARRARYFVLRAGYAALLALVMWFAYQMAFSWNIFGSTLLQRSATFASGFYHAFTSVQLFVALFLTPAFVAAAIPQEKERRTIEYLFVSDLRSREIVLGKLLARVMNLLMILLVGVPVVALAGLFGGVNYLSLLANTAATIMVMLSVAGLSMLVSIYSSTTRQSLFNTYAILMGFSVLGPLMATLGVEGLRELFLIFWPSQAWQPFAEPRWVTEGLMVASLVHPLSPLIILNSFVFSNSLLALSFPMICTIHACIHLLLATIFISWAIYRLRPAYKSEPVPSTNAIVRVSKKYTSRFKFSRPPVWESSPLVWKEFHTTRIRRFGWAVTILFILGTLYYYGLLFDQFFIQQRNSSDYDDLAMATGFTSIAWMVLGYLMVAFRSASSIGEERDRDCWISLLATPLTARELIFSKVLGSVLSLWPYILVQTPAFLMCVLFVPAGIFRLLFWFLGVFVFGLLIASMGVYQSLTQKSTGRAIGVTLFISAILAGLGHAFILPVVAFGGSPEFLKFLAGSLPWTWMGSAFLTRLSSSEAQETWAISLVFMLIYTLTASVLISSAVSRFPQITERKER
ncbi:ABC transporter permease subunit [bacterium]|nr:ABC transporter permease subunit [bacterium]